MSLLCIDTIYFLMYYDKVQLVRIRDYTEHCKICLKNNHDVNRSQLYKNDIFILVHIYNKINLFIMNQKKCKYPLST